MKKIMSYVFGLILCTLCFIPLQANAEVKAESISDPLVVLVTSQKVDNQSVKITLKVEKNTGLCGLQLNLKVNRSEFTITSSGSNLSSLTYEGDNSTGIYIWAPTTEATNVKKTGTILTLTLKLTDTATDGIFTAKFSPIACYYNGAKVADKPTAIQSAKIVVSNGAIDGTETYTETGLPTWAIVLIVLGGVAVVSGAILVIKTKKKPKTWKKIQ